MHVHACAWIACQIPYVQWVHMGEQLCDSGKNGSWTEDKPIATGGYRRHAVTYYIQYCLVRDGQVLPKQTQQEATGQTRNHHSKRVEGRESQAQTVGVQTRAPHISGPMEYTQTDTQLPARRARPCAIGLARIRKYMICKAQPTLSLQSWRHMAGSGGTRAHPTAAGETTYRTYER